MEDLKLKILSRLKEIRLGKLIYPSISGLFMLITLTLFVFSANFISKHINLALSDGEILGNILSLNKNDFEPIRKKLNIKINENAGIPSTNIEPAANVETPNVATTTIQAVTTAETATSTPSAITPEEKRTLKISVLNSTKTSGLAAGLKKVLEESGFVVEKTGNTSPVLTETILKIKIGKEKYKDVLVQAVSSKYPVSNSQEIPADDPYDVIIVIGK